MEREKVLAEICSKMRMWVGIARRYAGEAEAEDVVQLAMVRTIGAMNRGVVVENPFTWFYQVIRSVSMEVYRKKVYLFCNGYQLRQIYYNDLEDPEEFIQIEQRSVEEELIEQEQEKERLERFRKVVEDLPEIYREAIQLWLEAEEQEQSTVRSSTYRRKKVNGFTMASKVSTVKVRFYRARKMIRDRMLELERQKAA